MDRKKRRYLTMTGKGPKGRIPHWEAWSNPDAETYLTGIDYYVYPKRCRQKMRELYPELGLGIPETDEPRPRQFLIMCFFCYTMLAWCYLAMLTGMISG